MANNLPHTSTDLDDNICMSSSLSESSTFIVYAANEKRRHHKIDLINYLKSLKFKRSRTSAVTLEFT